MPHPPWLSSLLRPEAYPHPTLEIRLLETHISWVLLTGEFAYKLKKPVRLDFVDCSSLQRRKRFCHEEIRLNQRLAPQLYLGVEPICGRSDAARIGGDGPPWEFAVKMRQFAQSELLSATLQRGELLPRHVDRLAELVAGFHQSIAGATDPHGTTHGDPAVIRKQAWDNLEVLAADENTEETAALLPQLALWTRIQCRQLEPAFARRQQAGFVRECHGDMHLGNMILHADDVLIFDGIEFNAELRWIDVMSEVAFCLMDLEERGRPDLAHRLLDAYLQHTADFDGLEVLEFYVVYRALVRAKVAAIRLRQELADPSSDAADLGRQRRDIQEYLRQAVRHTVARRPRLLLTHGVSGSGKSYGAQRLVDAQGWIRLRSDVERKRLHGLAPLAESQSGVDQGIYTTEADDQTYARLTELAERLLKLGRSVLVDATFLKARRRRTFTDLARRLDVPLRIVSFQASEATLRDRIAARRTAADDASEADLAVLQHQLQRLEPLSSSEHAAAIIVDATDPDRDVNTLVARVAAVWDQEWESETDRQDSQ